jgi:hypothetical protein
MSCSYLCFCYARRRRIQKLSTPSTRTYVCLYPFVPEPAACTRPIGVQIYCPESNMTDITCAAYVHAIPQSHFHVHTKLPYTCTPSSHTHVKNNTTISRRRYQTQTQILTHSVIVDSRTGATRTQTQTQTQTTIVRQNSDTGRLRLRIKLRLRFRLILV